MRPFAVGNARDRTAEFNSVADRLRKEQGSPSTSGQNLGDGAGLSGGTGQHSEFARRAARIGQGIHTTSQKLFKLSQLAKRSSMFDDPAQEIADLSSSIKQEIQLLNAGLADMQNFAAVSRDNNVHSQNHSHTVVDNLRTRLKDTTKEFSDVLNMRKDNLKVHQGRRQLFSAPAAAGPSASQNWRPAAQPPIFGGASGFRGNLRANGTSNGQPSTSERAPLLQDQDMQLQQQQQMALAPPQDTYLNSRAEALRNVESTIHELGGIFQQLAVMVQEQGELAIRIDENVDESLANVESAQAQLLKYLKSVSSNRWLVMKVFLVLMIFLVIFVVFVA